jgi:hypothetical protein
MAGIAFIRKSSVWVVGPGWASKMVEAGYIKDKRDKISLVQKL